MRVGIDLTAVGDPERRRSVAVEADRLGLWAVLVGGPPGTETIEAATIAPETSSIHLGVLLDGRREHPLTLAEELAVLDHLSDRRALAVIDGDRATADHIAGLLDGNVVDGVSLSPPPAQTQLPVWVADDVTRTDLSGDLEPDGELIDRFRDEGCTHLFVTWPGPLPVLARHLVTRAAGPEFPTIVAEMADRVAPPSAS